MVIIQITLAMAALGNDTMEAGSRRGIENNGN